MKYTYMSILPILMFAACGQPASTGSVAGGQASCSTRAYAEIGGPISLIDQTGARVTEANFKGQSSLIYFGFTYCPDVCPTALVTIDRALKRLPDDIPKPRTILISVDPERDTPEALSSYISTSAFPDDIVGLTGTPEEIKVAADVFKSGYTRVEAPESLAEYTMDHTSIIYLMDANWQLKTFFTHETTDESMATCLAEHLG